MCVGIHYISMRNYFSLAKYHKHYFSKYHYYAAVIVASTLTTLRKYRLNNRRVEVQLIKQQNFLGSLPCLMMEDAATITIDTGIFRHVPLILDLARYFHYNAAARFACFTELIYRQRFMMPSATEMAYIEGVE